MRRASGGILCILIASCFLVGCGYKTNPRPSTATMPGEIGSVDAHAYSGRAVLRWSIPLYNSDGSPFKDISGFKVYRTLQKIGEECENCEEKKTLYANIDFQSPSNAVISKGEVVYTDTAVRLGNVYNYSVSAYNLKGREGPTSPDVTVAFDEAPPAPEGLRAEIHSSGISLEWTAPPGRAGIEGYRVYRGSTDKPDEMNLVGSTKRDDTLFVDKETQEEKTYYYAVRSLKINRGVSFESEPSPIVKVRVPAIRLQPPENVSTAPTRSGIRIYWDQVKIPDKESRYNIYRSEAGKMFVKLNPEPLRNASFIDRNVARGKTYRYAVTAFPEGRPEDESSRSGSTAVKYIP